MGAMAAAAEERSTPSGSTEEPLLRVSGSSNVQDLASAIGHALYEHRHVKMRAIGAGAVNQMAKACAIARGIVAPRGENLVVIPGFETITGNEGEISALVFEVSVQKS